MLKLFCGLLAACWCACAGPTAPGFNLPDTVRPARYALDLRILPEEPVFTGQVTIDVNFEERTAVFWVNAKDLTIQKASLEAGGASSPLRVIAGNEEAVGFEAASPIEPGPAQVRIDFSGKLNKDDNVGAFRRRLGDRWYVFTTFTPIEARRAFPCFDDPRFKTPWQLTLHVKREEIGLGNAPMLSETDEADGMKKVVFAATQPLPAEVVAFAVGPFDIVDAGTAGRKHIRVRVITPHGQALEAEAARKATPEILARLEDYTGIPYPWDKLDHLALAKGAYGAVENPGLITYQEALLLAKPARDTAERQHQMRSVMAHELAHQWFGNLVTQASWTDVWLSEGFSTWLSTKVMEAEYPPFDRTLSAGLRQRAMALDAAMGDRPVRRAITSRKEAKSVYNGLVYNKAAAVLDTVEDWLGEDVLQRGLRTYLEAHAYKNASTDDLGGALKSASGEDVGVVLHSLLDRAGVPVLKASVDCSRLEIQPADWTIPVCLHWDDGGHQCNVVGRGQKSLEAKADACPNWLWTNSTGRGYYRSHLSASNLTAIFENGYRQMSSGERLSLVSDLGAMVRNGEIAAGTAMKFLTGTGRDSEPAVALESLRIAAALEPSVPRESRAEFANWMRQTFGAAMPANPLDGASIGEFFKERKAAK